MVIIVVGDVDHSLVLRISTLIHGELPMFKEQSTLKFIVHLMKVYISIILSLLR